MIKKTKLLYLMTLLIIIAPACSPRICRFSRSLPTDSKNTPITSQSSSSWTLLYFNQLFHNHAKQSPHW